MTANWRIPDGAAPGLHFWGDEAVVHHALSNDTYRVSELAGRMLRQLIERGTLDAAQLAEALDLDEAEVGATLDELQPLGLVEPC